MSKAKQKLKRLSELNQSQDVTLNDCANAKVCSSRLKKNAIHDVTTEVKLLNICDDNRAWNEKIEDLTPVIGDDEDPAISKRSVRRKRKTTLESERFEGGIDYPLDVWYLISEHISPEDVGAFAAICRSTNAVVNSAKFWFSLYERWYRPVDTIPEILRPACMVRKYRLRALVIRSLYYTYPPFVVKYQTKLESDPHKLIGRDCLTAWIEKVKGMDKDQWVYCFKLKERTADRFKCSRAKTKPDLLEILDDIHANEDNGCKLLQVRANNMNPLPLIMGQSLIDCALKMSADLSSHCLQLQFACGPSRYQVCHMNINCVVSIRVLDWWHPAYPHNEHLRCGGFSSLLPEDCDVYSD